MAASEHLRIAILLDHIESDYHAEIIAGALRAARSSPVRVLIVPGGALSPTPANPAPRNFVFDLVLKGHIDGVLILGGSLSNHCGMARFREWARRFEALSTVVIGLDLAELPNVRVDNGVGVHALVTHLIEKHSRRRIAFIRGPAESPEAEARRLAYMQALGDHGISVDPRLIVAGSLEREAGIAAVGQLFDDRHFTVATLNAIVAVNDDVALGALGELTRRGILVPDLMSVVGFDDAVSARIANPPMTTVNQRVELQAYTAMRALIDALEGRGRLSSVLLHPETMIRASCGCASPIQNHSRAAVPPRLSLARTCRMALIERRSALTSELARAASGRIAGMSGWESKLLDALERDLSSSDDASFGQEMERMARRQLSLGHDPVACHDILTTLRIHVLACAAVEPDSRPRIEDIFQESRLTLARVGSDVARDRQRSMNLRMRAITKACLSLIGAGKVSDVEALLKEQLALLGISAFAISRFRDDARPGELELVVRHSSTLRSSSTSQVLLNSFGLDAMFEQEKAIVIEPLEFAGRPVGIAAFAWGAHDPVHYEQLRELLSATLRWPSR